MSNQITAHLSERAILMIDDGIFPGGGHSRRLEGMLLRYSEIVDDQYESVLAKLDGDIPALLDLYVSQGDAKPWLAAILADIEVPGGDLAQKLLELSRTEICVLEEVLACIFRQSNEPECQPLTGPELKALRIRAGLTQGEAAEVVGVPKISYQQWENEVRGMSDDIADVVRRELGDPRQIAEIIAARTHQPRLRKPRA